MLAALATNNEIVTIEGLADADVLHPIQQAFIDHTAFQCSYCTPGFILMTKVLLEERPALSVEEIREYLAGNLCRCGSYVKIVDAVLDAAERLRNPGGSSLPERWPSQEPRQGSDSRTKQSERDCGHRRRPSSGSKRESRSAQTHQQRPQPPQGWSRPPENRTGENQRHSGYSGIVPDRAAST